MDAGGTEGRLFLSISSNTAFGQGKEKLSWELCQTILKLFLFVKKVPFF